MWRHINGCFWLVQRIEADRYRIQTQNSNLNAEWQFNPRDATNKATIRRG